MEKALINTKIAHKYMEYDMSLKMFFKDEFKIRSNAYLVPFSHILYTKRTVFQYIRDSCSYVCPYEKQCKGHQFLNYIEMLWRAICWSVEEKKVFFKYFLFDDFRLTTDVSYSINNKDFQIHGWHAKPVQPKDLSHLSYSKRMSYLN